jgi:hypothetical protein
LLAALVALALPDAAAFSCEARSNAMLAPSLKIEKLGVSLKQQKQRHLGQCTSFA